MTQSTTTRGQAAPTEGGRPARAGRAEAVRFAATHTLPVLVRDLVGPHARLLRPEPGRPRWPAATLRALRARHGGAPVLLRGPTGPTLVLLDPLDLHRFHEAPPSELAAYPPDKCRAPGAAPGRPTRHEDDDLHERRREVNEIVLASGSPVHPSCGPFLAVIADEAGRLGASHTLGLTRARHIVTRAARRMVLGDTAAGDEELAGWLDRLDAGGDAGRSAGTAPPRPSTRRRARASPGTPPPPSPTPSSGGPAGTPTPPAPSTPSARPSTG